MSSGRYMAYSPSPSAPHSPHIGAAGGGGGMRAASVLIEQEKYLSELLSERNKISPFIAVLPYSYRLLNQAEILRVTTLLGNASVLDQNGLEQASPWLQEEYFQMEELTDGHHHFNQNYLMTDAGFGTALLAHNWLGSQGSSSGLIVKRMVRVDIPVEQYPNFNFVGRLLGPRGNSLKRVEAATDCRVLIRGRGSVKDPARLKWCVLRSDLKEEMMRGKPGYEHLNEPLHILVEAELPVEIIDARLMQAREILEDLLKPMDESQDFYKQQQLRELAVLNGTLREEASQMSGSVSPFNSSLGMKRAKTGG
ncbi:hypothetical protein DH2020_033219 [Rehmannia glutinosa]|uniref:K Homology domain-containing protein n=1 Tax=Rehmannia glutinosa TaxID=99300 RepID=A0ABR0VG40_REHGL